MATGTATLDFGAFPGKGDATVAVTGQAAIVAGSLVEAWVRPVATAEHSADEHTYEHLKVVARDIVAGTGFTIYGFEDGGIYAHTADGTTAQRLYGTWTIAWAWV